MTREEFKRCFDAYFDSIRNHIYYKCSDTELATDIVQDVFLKVWEKRESLTADNIKSLLYKMASDQLISHFRRNDVANKYVDNEKFHLEFKQRDAHAEMEYAELKETYEKVLAKLPEKQRSVFLMSRMEELTYKEIAERLELSEKAVEKRMSIALSVLKEQLYVK